MMILIIIITIIIITIIIIKITTTTTTTIIIIIIIIVIVINNKKILWNFSIQTNHEVIYNKPDMIVVDKIYKTANLIDIAVPNDYNICNKRL